MYIEFVLSFVLGFRLHFQNRTGFVNVLYNPIVLLRWLYLYLNTVCRQECALLAARILDLISFVSSLAILITVPKYLTHLTTPVS